MPCRPIIHDGKMVGIACSRGRRAQTCSEPGCTRESTKLCDWPTPAGKTCDRPLCALHAWRVGPDRDYCGEHHALDVDAMKF